MPDRHESVHEILDALEERAKELTCLYKIEELLNDPSGTLDQALEGVVCAIPPGWQYPECCQARITFKDVTCASPGFQRTPWVQEADIIVRGEVVGTIEVCYTRKSPQADEGPFLKEERKLITTIAERLGHFVLHQDLVRAMEEWQVAKEEVSRGREKGDWGVVLDLLRRTDQNLLTRISRKMINHLCWSGVEEAEQLLRRFGAERKGDEADLLIDANMPRQREELPSTARLSEDTFRLAAQHLGEEEIVACLQKWIKEDKSSVIVNTLESLDASLTEISDTMTRCGQMTPHELEFPISTERAVRVALVRRFFTDQLRFINVAKDYIDIDSVHDLFQRMIFHQGSHGQLGGKSSGVFLASQIIEKTADRSELLDNIKVPKTWYVVSDGLRNFISRNNLEDVLNQRYKEIEQVRQEYPHIIQVFKNSSFSADVVKGLSMALDDFEDRPLIVRSSSLLEDRFGATFSGKYKSLFLANRGTKQERLAALMDAVAEVYASTFSPDPIEYRSERGLLDFHEEMGIMIQEVVGTRVGHYFFPAFSGVAFSRNEFRWSPRIKREDGLVRMVPGLGTRAVDRLSDDYPILISPGQPGLRVNVTLDETVRYSPRKLDVINLDTGRFETVDVARLLKEQGRNYPAIERIVSILDHDHLRRPMGRSIDFEQDNLVVTFDGIVGGTPFTKQVHALLRLLEDKLNTPVDIEFAHDGTDFYLLQCRPQSHSQDSIPASIPQDLPRDRVLFSANHHVSNGQVLDITHVVYVDPESYNGLSDLSQLAAVGRVVSKLNKLLPKRRFILMGPGRWGSRGDVKLGVKVTYSDINNTAALIEIARKKGDYLPDLSFGTHFFQDLVESSIRYLPLYPDDDGVVFNELFFNRSPNVLADLLPEAADLAGTVRVIDVPQSADKQVLCILMNADLDEAVGILAPPEAGRSRMRWEAEYPEPVAEDHWRWRMRMAEHLAGQLDPDRFGVKALYVFGSTKNASAGPGSDIDILVHFAGSPEQQDTLMQWLEGWSLCLSEMNYLHTGYHTDGLLDIHMVTDDDIAKRTSYAAKIDAITDPARPLPLRKDNNNSK
ncbi:MAG: nucleotidyltransferase domain-containing protein [Phycisphaerae bacterium]|nr:nucleotidyltransferase domain-containing protein [Phycisphaerae bacterium]